MHDERVWVRACLSQPNETGCGEAPKGDRCVNTPAHVRKALINRLASSHGARVKCVL